MQRHDGSWLFDGLIPVPELKDRLALRELPDEDRGRYNTLAGMVMLLLGRLPVNWIQDPWPIWVALGTAAVVIAEAYWHPRQAPDSLRMVLWADAAGLAVFTITGTELALDSGISGPVAVLLGVLTGTGGGVARDVLARQRPLVLAGQIYALSAVAGGAVLVLLTVSAAPYEAARWAGVAVTLILRLLAIRYSWALPPKPGRHPENS